ncbi:tetratricopeptide repeat protein [Bacillus sp. LL01]|uniref:tetratricopeptide repeat protein n=1 Tax=Bacillus sp. LL01 TaxID=1665556 RepID=UPI002678096C
MVDQEQRLSALLGMKIVPNGIFIDEDGTIRLIKQGFHVTNEEHTEAIKKLVNGEVEQVVLEDDYYKTNDEKNPLKQELANTKFRLGMVLLEQGKKEEALKELDEALNNDPENFLIRKQRWYIRYPEKFEPTIDIEWQKLQLKQEREAEECGPDGCKIPGT